MAESCFVNDPQYDAKGWRLPAAELECIILHSITSLLEDEMDLLEGHGIADATPDVVLSFRKRTVELIDKSTTGNLVGQRQILSHLIHRITVCTGVITIAFNTSGLDKRLRPGSCIVDDNRRLGNTIPFHTKRHGRECKIVV